MVQDSAGVISAREFVWWFNAHPDAKNLAVDLSKVSMRRLHVHAEAVYMGGSSHCPHVHGYQLYATTMVSSGVCYLCMICTPIAAHACSQVRSVAVCGIGNVALDCARVLLQPPASLKPTDIAEHAMQQLRSSSVTDVHLFARRGPVQVRHHRGARTSTGLLTLVMLVMQTLSMDAPCTQMNDDTCCTARGTAYQIRAASMCNADCLGIML